MRETRFGRVIAGVATAFVIAGAFIVAPAGSASADPPGPPDYGVVEPKGIADKGCPWPDEHNELEMHADAQKCLPASIPWSGNEHDGVVSYGVRIISDNLVDGTNTVKGQVTFRCQSRVGLQYKVTVQGLQPRTDYSVEALQFGYGPRPLGTLTTDKAGDGILNGTLHLEGGGYGFLIFVNDASDAPVLWLGDEGESPGVVGIAVLSDPANRDNRP